MAAQHNKFINEYLRLIGEYSKEFQKLAQPVANRAFELIKGGMGVGQAIGRALAENNFFGRNQDVLMNVLFRAAAYGYGIDPGKTADIAEVNRKLLHEEWAPDKMNLSERLHGLSAKMRQEIVDTISSAMRQQKAVKGLAMDLYDGYNSGKNVINKADLADYLGQLQKVTRRLAQGDSEALGEFNRALKMAQKNIDKLSSNDAPTRALKAAYQKVIDAAEILSEKALDNAVHVAVEEKSRYLAERIARTEISAAWGEAFFSKYQDNHDVIAYRWRLSSRHSKIDICDFYAYADLYGLGPGIYPKDKLPRHPAHPHCMCLLEPVFEGEIHIDFAEESKTLDSAELNKAAGDEYLKSLSEFDQKQLLGADGWKEWKGGKDWQQHLHNWEGTEKPETRFKSDDFEEQPNRIPEGEYNLKIRSQVQKRHIEGTKEYEKYAESLANLGLKPGIITYPDTQELVNKYHGKGEYEASPDSGIREKVITDQVIGQYWNRQKRMYIDTKAFRIVYSKRGAHIFPVWDGKKE